MFNRCLLSVFRDPSVCFVWGALVMAVMIYAVQMLATDRYDSLTTPSGRHDRIRYAGGGVQFDSTEAEKLKQKVRIVTWVMTHPANHRTKADAVKQTWGRRVNKLLFMSSGQDNKLPTIKLNISHDSREMLWKKTRDSFQYVYDNHLQDGDWFMRADDDTYVIMENLRYVLSVYDPNVALLFGSRFKKYSRQGYMSGGAGQILSKAALKIFIERAMMDDYPPCGIEETFPDDAAIGMCLNQYGVKFIDTRDEWGKGRFFPFFPSAHLQKGFLAKDHWYWKYQYYSITNDKNCCSPTAISFHYMDARHMHEMEYLIYRLRPYGITNTFHYPPPLPPDLSTLPREVLKKYRKHR